MRIYFSGIGGVGIGPLAAIAIDAGYEVLGSDMSESEQIRALAARGAHISIGQDGSQIAASGHIDWFVHTAALPDDHPELAFARTHGIRVSKRDELLAQIIRDKKLELIAVSGTHGKTTTSGMLVWALQQLDIPVSYSVGTSLSFGPSGAFIPESRLFIYECDEFDRNMLHFEPALTLITSLDHDHADTYPTEHDYKQAFADFLAQSHYSLLWERDLRFLQSEVDVQAELKAYDDTTDLAHISLAGAHNRQNAYLVEAALRRILPATDKQAITSAINTFPGTSRRMEKLVQGLYTDYAHHPAEIAATLQLARELSDTVVAVYQPHQNTRQHSIKADYRDSFALASSVYWLPTYLSREDASLAVLRPDDLITYLANPHVAHVAAFDDDLWHAITTHRRNGALVVVMGAGDIDAWVRQRLASDTAATK